MDEEDETFTLTDKGMAVVRGLMLEALADGIDIFDQGERAAWCRYRGTDLTGMKVIFADLEAMDDEAADPADLVHTLMAFGVITLKDQGITSMEQLNAYS